jgi:hypothetical protein
VICTSVNLIRFIVRPLVEVGLHVQEKPSGRSERVDFADSGRYFLMDSTLF